MPRNEAGPAGGRGVPCESPPARQAPSFSPDPGRPVLLGILFAVILGALVEDAAGQKSSLFRSGRQCPGHRDVAQTQA